MAVCFVVSTPGFNLPDPAGKEGGACISSLLQVLYERGHEVGTMSWISVLQDMWEQLKNLGYDQVPQVSSSRWIDVYRPMYIVPPRSGKRRAMIIGVNYVGQQGQLKACHNDADNMKEYLIKAQGFNEEEMLILKDDGRHMMPTKQNIMDGFVRLTQYSQPGDVVFVSFSGHGGRVVDEDGDEDDGYDESIIPVDFRENGQIVDDDILKFFVKRMKGGVFCVVVMDCCHSGKIFNMLGPTLFPLSSASSYPCFLVISGTVLDLPYSFPANKKKMQIERNFPFDEDDKDQKRQWKNQKHAELARGGDDDRTVSTAGTKPKVKKFKPKPSIREQPIEPVPPRPPRRSVPPPPPPPKGCCEIL